MKNFKYIFYFSFLMFVVGCSSKKTELVWDQSFYQIGSQSSPKAADLNEDGILDIVIGAGREEMAPTDMGVLAIDGSTGELLWQQKASAHMVGSAKFYDITGDGVQDVFIGGRNHNLKALDGKTGKVIWEYLYQFEEDPVLKYARFNFYNSTLVPDQNNDGYPDLLTVNGGNWDAKPGTTEDRFPGVLLLFNLKNGEILTADTMPDGKESYMSPVCFAQPGSEDLDIIFGTGGETLGGNLYQVKFSDFKAGQLSRAKVIATEVDHGFIAPPVIADITQDGFYDIIAVSHSCDVLAIDGKKQELIWKQTFEEMESSNSFAVGHFNNDDIPDFFTIMNKGVWPNYSNAMQLMLDGKNGEIIYKNSIGCFEISSPVAYDVNRDGYDEVILSINEYDCSIELTEDIKSPPSINNQLISIDFQRPSFQIIDQTEGFKNIYSTPWIGDLDKDGYLDIVYCQYFNPNDLARFLGMRVKRISTPVRMRKAPKWGEYMGENGNGIFAL